jgi:hypothetical protein
MLFFSCAPTLPEDVAAAYKKVPDEIDYNRHIKPFYQIAAFPAMAPTKEGWKPAYALI